MGIWDKIQNTKSKTGQMCVLGELWFFRDTLLKSRLSRIIQDRWSVTICPGFSGTVPILTMCPWQKITVRPGRPFVQRSPYHNWQFWDLARWHRQWSADVVEWVSDTAEEQ